MAFTLFVAWVAIAFLLPIYLFGLHHGKPRSVEVGQATTTRSRARRALTSEKALNERPHPDVHTVHDIILHAAKQFPTRPAMGARSVIRVVTEEKEVIKTIGGQQVTEVKKWNFFELSGYSWMNYAEVKEHVAKLGGGLQHIGLKAGDKLTLFAATSRDWQFMAHAAFSQSIAVTTAYDTLGEEGLTFSLNECEITTLFTNADLLKIMPSVGANVPSLKRIIYNGTADEKVLARIKETFPHYALYHIDQIAAFGIEFPVDTVPPKPEDTAVIMYTSGSTGNPKGVVLTHRNIVAAVAGAKDRGDIILPTTSEVYLAYLPLAHVLELVTEHLALVCGCAIGYGSVRTLTDASVRNCKGDLNELRPTVMAGVPAVWETIRKAVMGKLKAKSPNVRRIFDLAVALKWQLIQYGLPTGFLDNTIFKPIRAQTGGRLRYAISGGAPMPKETQKFMTCTVCPILQGYGMTETCAANVIQLPTDPWMLGRVGPPTSTVEIVLAAVEDTNYHPSNRPRPQGEIWMRGPSVMKEYYKNPKATAETMTADGWLMTGDIGEFYPDGTIAIIDRKKNLVKLSNGEYIALEKLESQYKTSPYTHNICVYAHSEEAFAVAIVNPIEKEIMTLAKELGVPGHFDEVCESPLILKALLADLRTMAKNGGFKPAEILGHIAIDAELWTPENQMLTAAQKLKRKEIVEANKARIAAMYKAGRQ
ncbi:uncharacterized protein EV422DRAFT_551964 [Fimicolochytrium jonesii]|uniref:uncharacterized protein n=1 Tax=Fimicolochytrium jonesii TaxID=1396493 RepID=UPI0022FEC91B|nr:uncharacterized protein EV422DRAFT_551964 [Fimicolochytrium jonesii]KAI8826603.1 hypothetical protein EV422DRAFT_551964 [Fimicolochytrium jonesii]